MHSYMWEEIAVLAHACSYGIWSSMKQGLLALCGCMLTCSSSISAVTMHHDIMCCVTLISSISLMTDQPSWSQGHSMPLISKPLLSWLYERTKPPDIHWCSEPCTMLLAFPTCLDMRQSSVISCSQAVQFLCVNSKAQSGIMCIIHCTFCEVVGAGSALIWALPHSFLEVQQICSTGLQVKWWEKHTLVDICQLDFWKFLGTLIHIWKYI